MSYRLLSYRSGGATRAGIAVADAIYDAARLAGEPGYATVLGVLADWKRARRSLARAARQIETGRSRPKGQPLARARLAAPVLYPGAIYCAGANYFDHLLEMSRVMNAPEPPDPRTQGFQPWHFLKTSRAVVGPEAEIALPRHSQMVDWEIELAAVIGLAARDVPVGRALEHVAGYTIANDLSARDHLKRDNVPDGSPFKYDWISQKCFDGACPLGPWIVPADEIADPQRLELKLWVGDELMQDSHTSRMIFSVAEQIAFLSSRTTLWPGDLVLTGTPAGVGMARRRFLKRGESLRLRIEGIGELRHRVS